MLSKSELKEISSLLLKKNRISKNIFLADGKKSVYEGLNSRFTCRMIFVNTEFAESDTYIFSKAKKEKIRIEILKNSEFNKIIDTVTPQGIAAIFEIPKRTTEVIKSGSIIVALENISDPGNLGTIIRTCDWFGIENILLSENCADLYNPKVVRSTMGSVFHVNAIEDKNFYSTLAELQANGFMLLTAHMSGKNIFTYKRKSRLVLCFCNEANGPSEKLKELSNDYLNIPSKGKAESLNVANAAAIIIAMITNQ
jgi:TrmH family RNA methyltransferase